MKPAGATVQRTYWAIVENVPGSAVLEDSGMIDMPIGPPTPEEATKDGPKPASTHFQVLARHPLATWLRLQPRTGAPTSNGYPALRVEELLIIRCWPYRPQSLAVQKTSHFICHWLG